MLLSGELIGMEYLYSQTGRVLNEITIEDEDTEMTAEDPPEELSDDQLDEGFIENEDETVGLADEVYRVEDVRARGESVFLTIKILIY
jgi:hypothetical protein